MYSLVAALCDVIPYPFRANAVLRNFDLEQKLSGKTPHGTSNMLFKNKYTIDEVFVSGSFFFISFSW